MTVPTLNGIVATPTIIQAGGTSTITVDVSAPGDESFRVRGTIVGTDQAAEVTVTRTNPVHWCLDPDDPEAEELGCVLLTCPDGGALTPTGVAGQFTFDPGGTTHPDDGHEH